MSTQRGVTLVELIITVSILAVLLLLGVPSFKTIIEKNRFETQIDALQTAISLARSEAVKRNARVAMCASTAAGDGCARPADWSQGWLVFVDLDGPPGVVNGRDEIVRVYDPLPASFTVTPTAAIAADGRATFSARGFSDQAGSFVVCENGRLDSARGVNLFATGRPQASRDENGNGVHESGDGTDYVGC